MLELFEEFRLSVHRIYRGSKTLPTSHPLTHEPNLVLLIQKRYQSYMVNKATYRLVLTKI